jgi:molecular chaperone DnaK (HSP70)
MGDPFNAFHFDDRKLVIGIDFGTTFTGVAWAETRRVSLYFILILEYV